MRSIFTASTLFLLASMAVCQPNLSPLLDSIEKNNKALQKYRQKQKVRNLQRQSENTLPDPVLSGFYLPFGNHNTPDYLEFQVSQQIEFPGVYGARKDRLSQEMNGMEMHYKKLRQEVLLEAQLELLRWRSLREKITLHQRRHKMLSDASGKSDDLYAARKKVQALEQKHLLSDLEGKLVAAQSKLVRLNGGKPIKAFSENEPVNLKGLSFEQVWSELQNTDPRLLLLMEKRKLAEHELKVKKAESLPDLIAGYNFQGVPGSNYHGFYAGLSIPLWNGQGEVEAARANILESDIEMEDEIMRFKSSLKTLVHEHNREFKKYKEFLALNAEFRNLEEIQSAKNNKTGVEEALDFYFENQLRLLSLRQKVIQKRAMIFQYRL